VTKITIRNLDEETKRNLQVLAAMHGHSMEAEIRLILRDYASHAPRFAPASHPLSSRWEAPLATGREMPPAHDDEVRFVTEGPDLIPGINRQLEKMGLSQFALPENPPLD